MARVLAAMAEQAFDPFGGVTERRVLADGLSSLDMEVEAARLAMVRAGTDPDGIDLLLTHTAVPEYLLSNSACGLHRELGLRPDCLAIQVEASGYSFLAQLSLAEQLVRGGRVRAALLVQSSAGSRLIDRDDPDSVLHGDGAAAVVVGRVTTGGVLSTVHRTDGTYPRALVASVPGGRWYDEGRAVLHRADPHATARIFLETADRALDVVPAALAGAGAGPGDVDFFAVHQGTPWLRAVTQETIGLTRARSVDTFASTGYLFGASIPLVLETAQERGLVEPGSLVVMYGGGVGSTYGATVLRWSQPVG